MEYKVITKHCDDCGNVIHGKPYMVGSPKRTICGFCWAVPGWPMFDPDYRARVIARGTTGFGALYRRATRGDDRVPVIER